MVCAGATLLVLTVVGLLFVRQLQTGLNGNLDTTLRGRAEAVITQVTSVEGPDFQDTGSGSLLRVGDAVAQVLGADGAVLQASDGQAGQSLLTATQLRAASRATITFDGALPAQPAGSSQAGDRSRQPVRLLAAPAGRKGEVVVVGTSREVVEAAVSRATGQLLGLGALVLVLASVGAYLLAAAALRPVERMRTQADDLGANDAGAGLEVPGTRDEVSRLAQTINALLDRLHDALERERSFVADAGHELRTPLTVLRGELELAQRPDRSRDQLLATVGIAAEEADRLIVLSEDLLTLAAAQGRPKRLASTDLGALAQDAVTALHLQAGQAGIQLGLHVPHPVLLVIDPLAVRRALDNLLSNALRVTPSGGTVLTRIETGTAGVQVSVTDDGPGFPPEFLPIAFERFRRADPARTRQGTVQWGTGLGLAIVKGIATAHGGTVSAQNRPGRGACVSFTLPGDGAADPVGLTP